MLESVTQFTTKEIEETIQRLGDLIRINTTNPPGNEIAACRYLAAIFDQEQIPYKIIEPSPNRASLVARLKGDGTREPLLLTSHLDVVPCERDKWSVDPFKGEMKDGFIWGRGAVDMKNMTALSLGIFLKTHREKKPLKRDLIFAAIADEEAGCEFGSKYLVQNHADLIQAEYALNEVGGFSMDVNGHSFYPIGVAEKGLCWLKITAKGTAGHGAVPHDDQAIGHVCLAGHKLIKEGLPFHNSKIVNEFVDHLAGKQTLIQKLVLKLTKNPALSDFVINTFFPDKARARHFKNMFRNLATPTMLKAGQKENVIPSTASMVVDGRILPGQTVLGFIDEVKNLIGDGFDIEILQAAEPSETPADEEFFGKLSSALKKHDPAAIPVPFLIPGFTDAQHYKKLGIKCYGFVPLKLPPDLNFAALFHGHDERLPVASLEFGLKVLWDVVSSVAFS